MQNNENKYIADETMLIIVIFKSDKDVKKIITFKNGFLINC